MNVLNLFSRFSGNPPATEDAIRHCQAVTGVILPDEYIRFLRTFNGGEGFIGTGSYVILWAVEELPRFNLEYEVAAYCPQLLLIGSDGCGEAFGFDYSDPALQVVQVPFVGMDPSLYQQVGSSFSLFLQTRSKRVQEP